MKEESLASKRSRSIKTMKLLCVELGIAAGFVATIFFGHQYASEDASATLKFLAVLLPILVLSIWWMFYSFYIRNLGEFEQSIAIRSIAIACAITLWITTAWGLTAIYMNTPALPLVFIAPIAHSIYGIVRVFFTIRYR